MLKEEASRYLMSHTMASFCHNDLVSYNGKLSLRDEFILLVSLVPVWEYSNKVECMVWMLSLFQLCSGQ